MISIENLSKRFDDYIALDNINCRIPDGCIYGMVGSNGAGKSTFLRTICGIYKADSGVVKYDGERVYENPKVKQQIAFVPDELYFMSGANLYSLAKSYSRVFKDFDYDRFLDMVKSFELPVNRSVNAFSKGMKRQAATILALSRHPKYMMFDETFDGLDPVMRNFVKTLICNDVAERGATAIVTSHSLRELEDTCDKLMLLHNGGVVLQSGVDNLKTSLFKVQVAFSVDYDITVFDGLDVVKFEKNGAVATSIIRGIKNEVIDKINSKKPLIFDILPLTLEEVFTYEMEALGYEFNDEKEAIYREK